MNNWKKNNNNNQLIHKLQ